ncbi:MAG: FeoA family protein [Candidatus Gastranaerophilaceae bacterium]
MKKLNEITKGTTVEILDFADNLSKCSSARFGLAIGQIVCCKAKIGPVIISKNQQTIAIGEKLSKKIFVKEV